MYFQEYLIVNILFFFVFLLLFNTALALQKYHTEHELVIPQDDPEESVFDTITSLMGNNITHMARRFTIATDVPESVSIKIRRNSDNAVTSHRNSVPTLSVTIEDECETVVDDEDNKTEDSQSIPEDERTAGEFSC